MTEELRHYAAAAYRTRRMKPIQWLEKFPDKWTHFMLEIDANEDGDVPPQVGIQPWIINTPRN